MINDKSKLDSIKNLEYSSFRNFHFMNIFNTRAPIKTEILRADNHRFMITLL